jgi:uncharacterized protein (TIGR03083 family)
VGAGIDDLAVASHARRLDWLEELVAWFENVEPSALALPVPACPGWTVNNVIAHIGYGAIIFWIVPATHTALDEADFAAAAAAAGDGNGAGVFAGSLHTLSALLRSHHPGDHAPVVIGPHTYGGLARLATTEMAVHRLDCQDALSQPRSMSADHALDALAWTIDTWLAGLVDIDSDPPPRGQVAIRCQPQGDTFTIGEGEPVATIAGTAVDLLMLLWGRPARASVTGDPTVVDWWTSLTARTTAVDARH